MHFTCNRSRQLPAYLLLWTSSDQVHRPEACCIHQAQSLLSVTEEHEGSFPFLCCRLHVCVDSGVGSVSFKRILPGTSLFFEPYAIAVQLTWQCGGKIFSAECELEFTGKFDKLLPSGVECQYSYVNFKNSYIQKIKTVCCDLFANWILQLFFHIFCFHPTVTLFAIP